MIDRPLWTCPACGRSFANRRQSHACGRHALAPHFEGRSEDVRRIFDAFLAMLESFGPVTVLPEKSRIAFQVRMSFAQLTPRRHWVNGHFVLARRAEDPPFTRVETISPRNHVHHFRLGLAEAVEGLHGYAREAYAVGRQEHLG
ncbi:MAG: hypothetical protein JO013_01070 [Alphaproteobacteria bacterium]|nr:hypothetical protein [Alphaproteobacteria bacterium]